MSQMLRAYVSGVAGLALVASLVGCGGEDTPVPPLAAQAVWTQSYPGQVGRILADGDEAILLAQKEAWVITRLAADGTVRWSQELAWDLAGVTDITLAGGGAVLVAGVCYGPITLGGVKACQTVGQDGQGLGSFLARVDRDGEVETVRDFLFPLGQVQVQQVAVDGKGRPYLAGSFNGEVDFGDGAITANGSSLFMVALDTDGSVRYSKRFGGSSAQVSGLTVDAKGGDVFLVGTFNGFVNFGTGTLTNGPNGQAVYLARLASNGEPRWARHYLGSGTFDARFDGAGIYVWGNAGGYYTSLGGDFVIRGPFATRLDGDGKHLWTHDFGDGEAGNAAVAVDGQGRVVVLANTVVALQEEVYNPDDPYDYQPAVYEYRRVLSVMDAGGAVTASKVLSASEDYTYQGAMALAATGGHVIAGVYLEWGDDIDFGSGPVDTGDTSGTVLAKLRLGSP